MQRTTRQRRAVNRTTTDTQADGRLTLGDVPNHNPKLARLMAAAMVLGKRPRCAPTRAETHKAALREQYRLAIDDPLLHLAVASGWGLQQDEPRRRQIAAMVEWCKRLLRDIPYDGSLEARFLLERLRPGLTAVTTAVASAAGEGLPLGRKLQPAATAVAAANVVEVLRSHSGRHDWQMTAKVLEYYGWDLGTESYRMRVMRLDT